LPAYLVIALGLGLTSVGISGLTASQRIVANRIFGFLTTLCGLGLMMLGNLMDTTVSATTTGRVHNIGLLSQSTNVVILEANAE
jgi:hypothetical protein